MDDMERRKILPLTRLELRTHGRRARSQPENKTYNYNHVSFSSSSAKYVFVQFVSRTAATGISQVGRGYGVAL
jgi:hypothetical protein